jgi:hypothetical protein
MKSGKNDFSEVQWYAYTAALLLGWRIYRVVIKHRRIG